MRVIAYMCGYVNSEHLRYLTNIGDDEDEDGPLVIWTIRENQDIQFIQLGNWLATTWYISIYLFTYLPIYLSIIYLDKIVLIHSSEIRQQSGIVTVPVRSGVGRKQIYPDTIDP